MQEAGRSDEAEGLQVGQPWLTSQLCPREVADLGEGRVDGTAALAWNSPAHELCQQGPSPPTPQPLCSFIS